MNSGQFTAHTYPPPHKHEKTHRSMGTGTESTHKIKETKFTEN